MMDESHFRGSADAEAPAVERPAPPAPLEYARRPSRRRRWRRVALLVFVAALVGTGVYYRRPITAKLTLLYWQRQCMDFSMPPGSPTFSRDPKVIAARRGDPGYRCENFLDRHRIGMPNECLWTEPPCFDRFEDARVTRIRIVRDSAGGPREVTIFLGQLTSPSGNRRLVHVTTDPDFNAYWPIGGHEWEVYAPATLTQPPRLLRTSPPWVYSGQARHATLYFGQRDPADPAHFTMDFEAPARGREPACRGTIHVRLGDDDGLTFELRGAPPKTGG